MGLARYPIAAPTPALPRIIAEHVAMPALPRERGGPGSVIALPSGSVASNIRPLAVDRRGRIATYEVLVANDSIAPVVAFAYAVGQSASDGPTSLSSFTVPALTSIATELMVPLGKKRDQRVVVEIHADGGHLTLDASPPRRPWIRGAATPLAIVAFALAGAAYFAARPAVLALGAPDRALAGSPVVVAYAARGASDLSYALALPSGREVAHGVLKGSSGTFSVALPRSATSQSYDVRVDARNAVGRDARAAHILAFVPAAPHRAKAAVVRAAISDVALSGTAVAAGTSVIVSYRAVADTGTVNLVDATNTVRSSALVQTVGGDGVATLLVPIAPDDQKYRVVVTVQKGATTANAEKPLLAKGNPTLAAAENDIPPNAVLAQSTNPDGSSVATTASGVTVVEMSGGREAALSQTAHSPISLETPTAASGTMFRVDITDFEPQLEIDLVDATGTTLAVARPKAGQTMAIFTAPVVSAPKSYSLMARFNRGGGEETFVRSIRITPSSK